MTYLHQILKHFELKQKQILLWLINVNFFFLQNILDKIKWLSLPFDNCHDVSLSLLKIKEDTKKIVSFTYNLGINITLSSMYNEFKLLQAGLEKTLKPHVE